MHVYKCISVHMNVCVCTRDRGGDVMQGEERWLLKGHLNVCGESPRLAKHIISGNKISTHSWVYFP